MSQLKSQCSTEREQRIKTLIANNGSDSFKAGEETKNTIFLQEALERRLLDEKISPRNNRGYMGRGILGKEVTICIALITIYCISILVF